MKGLIVAVLLYSLQTVFSQNCSYEYVTQPAPEFTICNPLTAITSPYLECVTDPASTSYNWYYSSSSTQEVTLVTSGAPGYNIDSTFGSRLRFRVTNETTGIYWCQGFTSDGPLRNSSISNIHMNYTSSLPSCTTTDIMDSQNNIRECADIIAIVLPSVTTSITTSIITDFTSITTSITTSAMGITTSIITDVTSFTTSVSSIITSTSTTDSTSITTTINTDSTSDILLEPSTTTSSKSTPTPSPIADNNLTLLIGLGAVCGLLAIIACLIAIAIIILCLLTKKQRRKSTHDIHKDSTTTGTTTTLASESINMEQRVSCEPKMQDKIEPFYETPPTIIKDINLITSSTTGNGHRPHGLSFSNPVYDITTNKPNPTGNGMPIGYSNGVIPETYDVVTNDYNMIPADAAPKEQLPNGKSSSLKRPYYAKPDLSKKRSQSNVSSQETSLSPPPPPIPPQMLFDTAVGYDVPSDIMSDPPLNIHAPASYILPRLIVPPSKDTALYDDVPNEVPHIAPDYEDPDINEHPEIKARPNVQESNYENPWGKMPTGIKRTKSRGSSTKSRSANPGPNSLSPCNNLFDDPTYDSPSHKDPPDVSDVPSDYAVVI